MIVGLSLQVDYRCRRSSVAGVLTILLVRLLSSFFVLTFFGHHRAIITIGASNLIKLFMQFLDGGLLVIGAANLQLNLSNYFLIIIVVAEHIENSIANSHCLGQVTLVIFLLRSSIVCYHVDLLTALVVAALDCENILGGGSTSTERYIEASLIRAKQVVVDAIVRKADPRQHCHDPCRRWWPGWHIVSQN